MTRRGLSGTQLQELIDAGVDLEKAKPLVKEGYSGDAMLTLAKKGVDAETAAPLATAGVSSDEVLDLTRKGADVKLAGELVTSDVPLKDIKYYANNGNDLEGVKWVIDIDANPKAAKLMYVAKNSRKFVVDGGVTGSEYYAIANNYCNWQHQPSADKKWKTPDLCQTIQASPLGGDNTKPLRN